MLRLGNLSNAAIGSTECGRIERTASRAKVITLKFFCKGISVDNVFVLITEVSERIGLCGVKMDTCGDQPKDNNYLIMFRICSYLHLWFRE